MQASRSFFEKTVLPYYKLLDNLGAIRVGIRRDALPSGIFFSKLLVFGVRDKFHVIFITPNFRIFKSAARYADRPEIDPGPRDSQKRKIGLPSCRNIAVFSVFTLFSEKNKLPCYGSSDTCGTNREGILPHNGIEDSSTH